MDFAPVKANRFMGNSFPARIFSVNVGSSSLKWALFRADPALEMEWSGRIEKIGSPETHFVLRDRTGKIQLDKPIGHSNPEAAIKQLIAWLQGNVDPYAVKAIGHRVVQGGLGYREHQLIDAAMMQSLRSSIPLAPTHLPDELRAIELFMEAFPGLPQVACFDTAFHRDMPFYSRYYPLPRTFGEEGLIRYGFHGLSYEYVLRQLRQSSTGEAMGNLVIAHLGNGASMAAIQNGKSLDTTMGLTPSGGLVMGTRSGDLDPGVLLYLLKEKEISVTELDELINRQSGLKGLSGTSSDMQDLLEKEGTDRRAEEAVALFCYQARKFIGALSAALGGLHSLVFTGGIGENASLVRSRICEGLSFLGIEIDQDRNARHHEIISTGKSAVSVRVIKTYEERMIAQHTYEKIF
jgi:acetate kinase